MTRTLYWRPCPFFCPNEPDYFRSWAALMAERTIVDGLVTIDVPSSTPLPCGTHDLTGCSVHVSDDNVIFLDGEAGARCE